MGHLINPISFRLGYSRNWGFSGALMESKSQYFYLNGSYWNILLFFKRIFSLQIFEKMGVMFSHLKYISNLKNDLVIIYLYDGPFEENAFIFNKYLNNNNKFKFLLKVMRKKFKKFMFNAFFLFYYLETIRNVLIVMNKFIFSYIQIKISKISYLISFLKSNLSVLDNIYLYKSYSIKKEFVIKKHIFNSIFLRKLNYFFLITIDFDLFLHFFFYKQEFFSYSMNFYSKCVLKIQEILLFYKRLNIIFFVKLYKFLFKKFKFINLNKFLNIEKNIFFKNIFNEFMLNTNSLNNLFIIKNLNFFAKKFFNDLLNIFFKQRIDFYRFFEKMIFSFGKKRKKKFIFLSFFFKIYIYIINNFFFFLKNLISFFKSFFFNGSNNHLSIYFKNVSKTQITAALINRYICVRLRQKFSLKEILKPILKDLSTNPVIKGFKISCCGRFTKKEIATYKWERRGKISLNSVDAKIDYSFDFVILKYSVCGIKVWLHRNPEYKSFFKKWFENYKKFVDTKKIYLKKKKKKTSATGCFFKKISKKKR